MLKEHMEEETQLAREKELEKEKAYKRMCYWENTEREAGVGGKKAASVIPAAQNNDSGNSSGGAVSGTDSESDAPTGKVIKDLFQVKWAPKLESELENMLVRNVFDFVATSKEFQRYLNSNELSNASNDFYQIDSKMLQQKWTDIEIRKHMIPASP